MRTINISKAIKEPVVEVKSNAIAKSMKYSVSRLMRAVIGQRHINRYHASSNIGTNDSANGENIAAATRAIVTYTFNKITTMGLLRLIISLASALVPVPASFLE